ncbi:MAG: hypothetical protein J1F37_06610 [Oscillospiraceae bacterium]|nr:hypothetical protein [Oscillospiraceae bacterium]
MKNRKMIFAMVAIFLVIMIFFAACKKKGDGIAYVTDENGVQLTDTNGEPITIIPETSIITITDGNGNVVTNENGETETSIYYKPQQVVVPVTDANHEAVTGENGEVLTTLVWFPADPTTTAIETVTVTDSNGDPVTNPGETVTEPNGDPVTEPNGDPVTKPGTPVTETTIITAANKSFSKTMGGTTGIDEAVAVVPASDGGVFAAVSGSSKDGMFQSISDTREIAFAICKYDNEGNLVWTKAFGSKSSVSAEDICETSDGGVIIVGQTRAKNFISVHGSEYDAFIMKLDKDGNEVFRKAWGGTANENFNSVKEAPDGNIFAAGFSYSQDGDVEALSIPKGDGRAVIVKFNSNGEQQKAVGIGGFGDYFADLAIARNGDIFAVASMNVGSTQKDYKIKGLTDAGIFRFDKDLNLSFGKVFGGTGRERFEAIAVTDDGGCVIAGASTSSDGDLGAAGIKNKGGEDAVIAKFSGSGSLVFVKSFYGNKSETFKDVTITSQGYIIAVGEAQSATRDFITIGNQGGKDVFVTRFNSKGDFISAIGYGGSGDDSALSVCTMTNGQIVIAGSTASTNGDFGQMSPASDGTKSVAFIKTVSF